jgi:hypothetical protein
MVKINKDPSPSPLPNGGEGGVRGDLKPKSRHERGIRYEKGGEKGKES